MDMLFSKHEIFDKILTVNPKNIYFIYINLFSWKIKNFLK